ncbi:type II toxin-antitoxin system PemK/MazF family toxin [Flavobacterium sp.]|uniref:type II toxin-antitoxin system PemK/MazF family toxin n=1 Tax=Flavobacterium sp. TaxID=239 RepID=UPI00375181C5
MVNQYEIFWVVLDPTLGSEINKIRPCLIISPNDSNHYLNTVLIAPITSTLRKFPMRVDIILENKNGQIALDQIRCIDKVRLKNKIDILSKKEILKVKSLIKEYLVD